MTNSSYGRLQALTFCRQKPDGSGLGRRSTSFASRFGASVNPAPHAEEVEGELFFNVSIELESVLVPGCARTGVSEPHGLSKPDGLCTSFARTGVSEPHGVSKPDGLCTLFA